MLRQCRDKGLATDIHELLAVQLLRLREERQVGAVGEGDLH